MEWNCYFLTPTVASYKDEGMIVDDPHHWQSIHHPFPVFDEINLQAD
jgi:hypothetical protein